MIPSKPGLQLRLFMKSELKKRLYLKILNNIYILYHILIHDHLTVTKIDHYVDYKLRFGNK